MYGLYGLGGNLTSIWDCLLLKGGFCHLCHRGLAAQEALSPSVSLQLFEPNIFEYKHSQCSQLIL